LSEAQSNGREPVLSVVIPAYNEGRVLRASLERIHTYLSGRSEPFEILPVDDGSSDDTAAVAAAFASDHPECRPLRNQENRGKGYSVRHGFAEARGRYVLFTDADLSTPIEEATKILTHLERDYDMVIGSRDLPDSDVRVHQPWYRETMGRIFNRIVRLLVVRGFVDTQCGFKGFRREAFLPALPLLRIERYSFDVEMLFVAQRMGLRIAEIPVTWVNCLDTRVDPLRDATRMFIDLLRIRYYHICGRYRPVRPGPAPRARSGGRP